MRNYIVLPRCTVHLAHGEFCDADAAEDMPFPICERHADQLHQRMAEEPELLRGIPCPECHRVSLQRRGEGVMCRVCSITIDPGRFRLWFDALAEETLVQDIKVRQQEVVYYISESPDIIKIGFSCRLRTRLTEIRRERDDVLATEPGGKELEGMRHRQFNHLSLGKWERFRPERDLLDHIAMIRDHFGPPTF